MINPSKTDRPFMFVGFDGPIHAFSSGWHGAGVVTDDPVPGAIPTLIELAKEYEVVIFSERFHWPHGRNTVLDWLKRVMSDRIGRGELAAVMSHIHLLSPPLRSDDLQRGDQQSDEHFDWEVDDWMWKDSRRAAAIPDSPLALDLPDPPDEPGGDSQHL